MLLGSCQLLPDDIIKGAASIQPGLSSNSNRLDNIYHKSEKGLTRKVDSFTNEEKTFFIKTNINEVYPETILIYRDKDGPSDQRTSRITELSKRYERVLFLSYFLYTTISEEDYFIP